MIRIVIKGTEADARQQLAVRGLDGQLISVGQGDTFWDLGDETLPKLTSWFCEATGQSWSAYPAGTLLYYR